MTYAESKVEFAMITEKGYKGIIIYGMTVNVARKYFRWNFKKKFFLLFYRTSFANSAVFMRSDNAALNICCPEGSQTAES